MSAPQSPLRTAWRTASAVAAAFFGVRKRSSLDQDAQQLRPAHVIAGGLVGAALFVLALLLLVRWVVKATAAA
jgi:hypothetical protein